MSRRTLQQYQNAYGGCNVNPNYCAPYSCDPCPPLCPQPCEEIVCYKKKICPPPCPSPCSKKCDYSSDDESSCDGEDFAEFSTANDSANNIVLIPGKGLIFPTTIIKSGCSIKLKTGKITLSKGSYKIEFLGNVIGIAQLTMLINTTTVASAFVTTTSQIALNAIVCVQKDSVISVINPHSATTDVTFQVIGPSNIIAYPYLIITKI